MSVHIGSTIKSIFPPHSPAQQRSAAALLRCQWLLFKFSGLTLTGAALTWRASSRAPQRAAPPRHQLHRWDRATSHLRRHAPPPARARARRCARWADGPQGCMCPTTATQRRKQRRLAVAITALSRCSSTWVCPPPQAQAVPCRLPGPPCTCEGRLQWPCSLSVPPTAGPPAFGLAGKWPSQLTCGAVK